VKITLIQKDIISKPHNLKKIKLWRLHQALVYWKWVSFCPSKLFHFLFLCNANKLHRVFLDFFSQPRNQRMQLLPRKLKTINFRNFDRMFQAQKSRIYISRMKSYRFSHDCLHFVKNCIPKWPDFFNYELLRKTFFLVLMKPRKC
jgi:hypothetical protein